MKQIVYKIFNIFPKLAIRLGGRNLFSIIGLYVQFVYTSVVWKLQGRKDYTFSFTFNNKTFTLQLIDSTDVAALEEIYTNGEYDWKLSQAPKTILDLGASYGDTALYYHLTYPEATIYAVEASPDSYKRLCNHVKEIPQIVPIHAAVADTDGSIELYLLAESSLGNSLVKRSENMQKVTVPAMTLATLTKKYNQGTKFDLIKFDIEGAEEKMFSNCKPEDYGFAYTGEIHYDLMGMSVDEVSQLFAKADINIITLNAGVRDIMRANFN